MAQNTHRVQVLLDDETFEALKDAAKDDHRTVSEYLRLRIKEMLGTM